MIKSPFQCPKIPSGTETRPRQAIECRCFVQLRRKGVSNHKSRKMAQCNNEAGSASTVDTAQLFLASRCYCHARGFTDHS